MEQRDVPFPCCTRFDFGASMPVDAYAPTIPPSEEKRSKRGGKCYGDRYKRAE